MPTGQRTETLPIHRWSIGVDSGSPYDAERILDFLALDKRTVVLDPFVGSGTIPIVCRQRGLSTESSDIDPLCVLTTRIKLRPPSEEALSQAHAILDKTGLIGLHRTITLNRHLRVH